MLGRKITNAVVLRNVQMYLRKSVLKYLSNEMVLRPLLLKETGKIIFYKYTLSI